MTSMTPLKKAYEENHFLCSYYVLFSILLLRFNTKNIVFFLEITYFLNVCGELKKHLQHQERIVKSKKTLLQDLMMVWKIKNGIIRALKNIFLFVSVIKT